MKTEEEKLKEIFNKNPETFPLGYQFVQIVNMKEINARISKSKIHNSNFYIVSYFYKPTSCIFDNENE